MRRAARRMETQDLGRNIRASLILEEDVRLPVETSIMVIALETWILRLVSEIEVFGRPTSARNSRQRVFAEVSDPIDALASSVTDQRRRSNVHSVSSGEFRSLVSVRGEFSQETQETPFSRFEEVEASERFRR